MSDPIAILKKNRREEIHVSLDKFKGCDLFNMRVWYEAEDGQLRPGKNGLAFKVDKLPEFIDAANKALSEAKARRLLK
jgi:hypothetical protein